MRLKRTIFLLTLVLSGLVANKAWATHERSGYIIWEHLYKANDPYFYKFTVVTFTKESSFLADRRNLTVYWGDGTHDSLPRTFEDSTIYPSQKDIKENMYTGTHSYSGPYTYQISMTDPNRIADVINIDVGNSVNIPICFIDTMTILDKDYFGFDSSPLILNPPLQFGAVGVPFSYSPAAYDPDGDSLAYILVPPNEQPYQPGQQVPGYQYPDQINSGANNKESLDPVTGVFSWTSPQLQGIYNVDIIVSEYRKINGQYYKIGAVDVDLQIIISATYDTPPKIQQIRDTCILAGSTLHISVGAKDTDAYHIITFTALDSQWGVSPPPTFSVINTGSDTVTGSFNWSTNCDAIRKQVYSVVFNASDNFAPPLNSQLTWNIHVVAPPPQGLKATATGNSIVLNWNSPYNCATSSKFRGFTVWRKTGCDSLQPDTCNPTASIAGFTQLTANPIKVYTYTDNSVLQGIDYAYRVVAVFADTTAVGYIYNEVYSLPSNQVCAYLKKDVPIITNVSVVNTDVANGSMYVAWSKPSPSALDTTEYPGPYKYDFYRSVGFNGNNPKILDSVTANSFYLFNDTSFEDTFIDTKDNPYSYIIKFYSNNGDTLVGNTNIASSIYLTLVGNNHQVALSWKENVPWTNDTFVIYRQNHLTQLFDLIAKTTVQTYTDLGLENDTTYCYKVESIGKYDILGIHNPLINYSQINCTIPVDSTRPCTPTLHVYNNCNSTNSSYTAFTNYLIWNLNEAACANSSILKYYIYYAAQENQQLQLIDSTKGPKDTTYISNLSNTLAGCYAVAAVDSAHTIGYKSNTLCVDNCPLYNLPNVFTPNGDEHNDLFTPIFPYQFIDHIDMHIFNRWGGLVFETNDPNINWNGKDFKSGKDCPDGVYYYTCEVFETTVNGVVKRTPPLKGYIHLLR